MLVWVLALVLVSALGVEHRNKGFCMPAMTWASMLGGFLVVGSALLVAIMAAKKKKSDGDA